MALRVTTLLPSFLAVLAMSLTSVIAIDFDNCRTLSHPDFYAEIPASAQPTFGPQGLYYSPTGENCIFLDVYQVSFAQEHPQLYKGYMSALDQVTADAESLGISPFKQNELKALARDEMELAATPGCGQVCADKCLYPCKCKVDKVQCVGGGGPDNCFTIKKCKG